MSTASNADSRSDAKPKSNSGTNADSDSASLFDRLETVGEAVWGAFLVLVVVFTLIPPVALWFGAVPFDAPPTAPYFAFVAATFVGAVALIAAGVYDV